jgi:hypothetical protein
MPSDPFTLQTAATRAEDLSDLLSHIGYTGTLRPTLLKLRENYEKSLVYATLGQQVNLNGIVLSCEQLAARAEAITYLLSLIEKILSKGSSAIAELQRTQLTTTI